METIKVHYKEKKERKTRRKRRRSRARKKKERKEKETEWETKIRSVLFGMTRVIVYSHREPAYFKLPLRLYLWKFYLEFSVVLSFARSVRPIHQVNEPIKKH